MSLTLVADARLSDLSFLDDQIWEVRLGGGDPSAVAAWTTYGLRARGMRIFPRLSDGGASICDPAAFWRPPAVHKLFPNYLLLTFSALPGLDVVSEYWVPDNKLLAGRIRVLNSGVTPRKLRLDLTGILHPSEGGRRMAPTRIQEVAVLAGQTENLAPVLFLTGGSTAAPNPYPSLTLTEELLPGLEASWVWVQAALDSPEDSFEMARTTAARAWDSEIARIELENATQVEIHTGDPDWDAAFALGQRVGLSLIHGPGPGLPHKSFVSSRTPDHGYSRRGDGMDHEPRWGGQTPLESWYLTRLLLPAEPALAIGLVKNFLTVQTTEGLADWKPGLAGQRSRLLATPILAHLCWKIFEFTDDEDFLEEVYPGLSRFFFAWFSPEHDRDADGVPEWDHVLQTGLDDHPIFSSWGPGGAQVDITACETASLNAFLFQEAVSLQKIAARIDRTADLARLEQVKARLKTATESNWNARQATYTDLDRDTHSNESDPWHLTMVGAVVKKLRRKFSSPLRMGLTVSGSGESQPGAAISLTGINHKSRPAVERIEIGGFRRTGWEKTITTENAFYSLKEVRVEGLHDSDKVQLRPINLSRSNLTRLLPLWAGIPDPRRARAILRRSVQDPGQYMSPYGLPLVPKPQQEDLFPAGRAVDILWNALIIEGVLAFGSQRDAAELLARVMNGVTMNLKKFQAFYPRHDAETGEGSGDRDSLAGLPPLGLFLDTLGVRLTSSWRVGLFGENPYPWPVEVSYRGLSILRGHGQTTVTFPDGEIVEVDDPADCTVER